MNESLNNKQLNLNIDGYDNNSTTNDSMIDNSCINDNSGQINNLNIMKSNHVPVVKSSVKR